MVGHILADGIDQLKDHNLCDAHHDEMIDLFMNGEEFIFTEEPKFDSNEDNPEFSTKS